MFYNYGKKSGFYSGILLDFEDRRGIYDMDNYSLRNGVNKKMMDTAWYFRLFYVAILVFIISFLLSMIIKAKRMGFPEGGKPWMIGHMTSFIIFLVLLWFVPFSINLAFWIGIGIIVFGEVVFALA